MLAVKFYVKLFNMTIKFKSNIGKQVIQLPENVQIFENDVCLIFKNQEKVLQIKKSDAFSFSITENELKITPTNKLKNNAYWGTYRNLIAQIIIGINSGFQQNLELFGIGYKGQVVNDLLRLKPGTSHDLLFNIPKFCSAKFLTPTLLSISGTNKQLVRETAVQIHCLRKPDAYKGKGVRLVGKTITLKEGKKQK